MAEKFEDLRVWRTVRTPTNCIYALSRKGEFEHDWPPEDQIRRTSISVMPNIAEGFERWTRSQFINFLGTAKASAGEVRSQLIIAHDQEYLSDETFSRINDLADKMSRQLYHLIGHLEQNDGPDHVRELPTEYVTD
jgi:four helix bundle protein